VKKKEAKVREKEMKEKEEKEKAEMEMKKEKAEREMKKEKEEKAERERAELEMEKREKDIQKGIVDMLCFADLEDKEIETDNSTGRDEKSVDLCEKPEKEKNHEENDGSEIYHDFENSSDEKSQNLLSGSEDDD